MKKLKQYPEYYDSEVEWLRNVPSHWEVVKSKRIFVEASIKGFPNEELLAATQTKGVIPKSLYGNTTVTATKNFETLKLVEKGDFVISLRSFQGGIEYAHYRGIISPAYTILKPQEEVVHKYYRYLLKSKRYISGLTLLVTGIREGQNIDTSKFKDSYLPLPPKQEQTTIANFLDYKTEKINRFITKKKQLVELLKEQKAAIINQAVTKGLNLNIEKNKVDNHWIKELPKSFSLESFSKNVYLKHGFQFREEHFSNEGIKIIKISQLSPKGFLDLTKASFVPNELVERFSNIIIEDGDILMALTGGTIGKIIRADINNEVLLQNYRVGNFYPSNEKLTKEYLYWLLKSDFVQAQMKFYVRETGQPNIGKGDFNKILIVIPPIAEQKEIVEYIETEKKTIDKTISTIEKEITLVEEYKTALIAEAVTGKIDVRDFKIPTQETPLAMVAEEAANYNKR